MQRSIAGPCVYYHPSRQIIIAVYVDDILIFGTLEEINFEKEALAE